MHVPKYALHLLTVSISRIFFQLCKITTSLLAYANVSLARENIPHHKMEMSCNLNAPAASLPGKLHVLPIVYEAGWVPRDLGDVCPCRESIPLSFKS